MKRLQGKVVLITGAASGIGEASARLFAAEGAILGLMDINAEGGQIISEAILTRRNSKVYKSRYYQWRSGQKRSSGFRCVWGD